MGNGKEAVRAALFPPGWIRAHFQASPETHTPAPVPHLIQEAAATNVAFSSACHRMMRSRLYWSIRQHRAEEPGAFGFQRRDMLEAQERVPSALAPTLYPQWEPQD